MHRRAVLAFSLLAACSSRSSNESEPDAAPALRSDRPLAAVGRAGRLHFSFELEPASPRVGELFQVVTTVRDARSGVPLERAEFELDATMPQHGHGMSTRPEHREQGEGRYLTEGMKLHMPGRWELRARARTPSIDDEIALVYEQPVSGS